MCCCLEKHEDMWAEFAAQVGSKLVGAIWAVGCSQITSDVATKQEEKEEEKSLSFNSLK